MKSTHHFLSVILLLIAACAANAIPEHPRLMVTAADWKSLPARMEKEPMVRKIIETTIARANVVIDAPPLTRTVTGRRMLDVSQNAVERVLDLATAWKVSGERKYLDRCREELLNVSSFKDWHPVHHLDTAEMQTAVAIGYDWLYDELTPDDRKTIETALLEKGLQSTLERDDIMRRDNNWNQVCMGGMVLSAIALMDVAPEISEKALSAARTAIQHALKASYPKDGAYAEGGGYWQYGTQYSILTAEALRTAKLPDAGIVSHPGFLESGHYLTQVYGTSGLLFNYGDTGARVTGASPAAAWMARETRSSNLRDLVAPGFRDLPSEQTSRFLALSAFWFPSTDEVTDKKLPLHFQGSGHSPITIHRTGFSTKDLFLGIKAGKASANHGHMDAGSFVIDWSGERWTSDLGKQDYHPLEQTGINLFEMTQESGRWTVFRLNNFSHNTLTYNGRIHEMEGAADILSSEARTTLLDMAAPLGLPAEATAKRRFTLDADASTITITDDLDGLKPGDEITWHMITLADVSKQESGFILSQNGKQMILDLSSAKSALTAPADPPPAKHDEANPGITRIMLDAIAGPDGRIRIDAVFRAAH